MKWLSCALLLALVGCGGVSPPPLPATTPVSGKVYLPHGGAMKAGRVIFKPRDKGQQEAIGEIAADGTYRLTSFNKDDGATPGDYVVVVEKVSYKTGSAVEVRVDVPKKYLSESTSDLVVTVTEGQSDYPLRLK